MVQFMYHVDSWKRCQNNHEPIIMHCVNEIKGHFNFYVNNLKLFKKKKAKNSLVNNIVNVIIINNINH
jgi:hypothetical protein